MLSETPRKLTSLWSSRWQRPPFKQTVDYLDGRRYDWIVLELQYLVTCDSLLRFEYTTIHQTIIVYKQTRYSINRRGLILLFEVKHCFQLNKILKVIRLSS